jgi:hypothetical protein
LQEKANGRVCQRPGLCHCFGTGQSSYDGPKPLQKGSIMRFSLMTLVLAGMLGLPFLAGCEYDDDHHHHDRDAERAAEWHDHHDDGDHHWDRY